MTHVVYESDIVVINKPSNEVLTHPGAGNWNSTLVNGLPTGIFPEPQKLPGWAQHICRIKIPPD